MPWLDVHEFSRVLAQDAFPSVLIERIGGVEPRRRVERLVGPVAGVDEHLIGQREVQQFFGLAGPPRQCKRLGAEIEIVPEVLARRALEILLPRVHFPRRDLDVVGMHLVELIHAIAKERHPPVTGLLQHDVQIGKPVEHAAHDHVDGIHYPVDGPIETKDFGPRQHIVADVRVLGPVCERPVEHQGQVVLDKFLEHRVELLVTPWDLRVEPRVGGDDILFRSESVDFLDGVVGVPLGHHHRRVHPFVGEVVEHVVVGRLADGVFQYGMVLETEIVDSGIDDWVVDGELLARLSDVFSVFCPALRV